MRLVGGLDLSKVLNEVVDWRFKGFPPTDGRVTVDTIGAQGWHARGGDMLLPLVVLKESALAHNIELMAAYARAHNLSLAPHGKTPMAPQIVQRQLAAGAWGVTVANVPQARVFRAFGAQRIFIANEIVESLAVRWLAAEMERDPQFECYALVDSLAGVAALSGALGFVRHSARPLPVLLEIGAPAGRAGCRTAEEALAVARAVRDTKTLDLAGAEAYEGAVPTPSTDERVKLVDRFLSQVRATASTLIAAGAFDGRSEILLSAGSSLFVDRVVALLADPWPTSIPVRIVARTGAYVSHDVDLYERLSPFAGRAVTTERMCPALELLAVVLSRPEPELAIVGFGKRDAPYDTRLPAPRWVWREGHQLPFDGATVKALNDQHAYLHLPPGADLQVADLVGFDVSHPCTTFDKWRLLPLVDDEYNVTGGILTFF